MEEEKFEFSFAHMDSGLFIANFEIEKGIFCGGISEDSEEEAIMMAARCLARRKTLLVHSKRLAEKALSSPCIPLGE